MDMSAVRFTGRHMVRIVWDLGWAEFRLKYRGSVLGYFWSLAVPMAKFIIFLYVFTVLFPVDVPLYPLYLFLGIILWEYFANITTACIGVPLIYEHLIQKVAFPRFLLLLMVGWVQTLIFFTHCIIFFFMSITMGASFTMAATYFPLVVLQVLLFALGIGAYLASYTLRYRDFPHLWNIVLQILFWLTPITYVRAFRAPTTVELFQHLADPLSFLGWGLFSFFVRFQPLSLMLFDSRRVLFLEGGGIPSLFHSVALTGGSAMVFGIGMLIFWRRSRFFLQEY